MLRDHGLAADVVSTVVEAARTVFDPRRLRSAQPFLLERTLDGGLGQFEYEIDANSYLLVTPIALDTPSSSPISGASARGCWT